MKQGFGRSALALLLILLFVTGCTTTGGGKEQYVKNGVQYGTTKGRFRGRWWNFYERGRSFSDGAFWKEAEKDFLAAQAGRARDQLWPRTYGLHFIPEYFPNRELGIVFYHQDRLDEAISALTYSLEQQHSARAAYFLDLARKKLIARAGMDVEAPSLQITYPAPDTRVGGMEVVLEGVAHDDTFISAVAVNGEPVGIGVSSKEVSFSKRLTLRPGFNEIQLQASDLSGKHTTETLRLECDVDGPALSFEEPIVLPGIVRGVMTDPGGVASLRIGGKPVVCREAPEGRTVFEARLEPEDLGSGPVLYECCDGFGNATRGTLPLDAWAFVDSIPSTVYATDRLALLPVSERIHALTLGGTLVGLATLPEAKPVSNQPTIGFSNLYDGQRYSLPEVVVSLSVEAFSPLEEIRLNGTRIPAIPGRQVQYLSRRISLEPGRNLLQASVRDAEGRESDAQVEIERDLSPIEERAARLAVVLLGNVWGGNGPALTGEIDFVVNEIQRELGQSARFRLLDRSRISEVITEQQLVAALGSREERAALGMLVQAETMLIGRVHRDTDSVEIVVEAISTETSLVVARADVAGAGSSFQDLTRMIHDLAVRIVQEFPRVEGQVAKVKSLERIVPKQRIDLSQALWEEARPDLGDHLSPMREEVMRCLLESQRFVLQNTEATDTSVLEQSIGGIAAPGNGLLHGNEVRPPDFRLVAQAERQGDKIHFAMHAVDVKTLEVVALAEEAGDFENYDEAIRLARTITGRLVERIPVRAEEETIQGTKAFTATLSKRDRVNESMKYVVFRYGEDIVDPRTQEVTGREMRVVGEALVDAVDQKKSLARVTHRQEPELAEQMRVGDIVVTK